MSLRTELALIGEWIAPGSRVLDLGCGDGALLAFLNEARRVTGYGLEIDPSNIARAIARGVNVIQTDLDAGLSDFAANSFDHVVMTQTLQAVYYPARLMEEMLRVGREGIVTFPNFGHWPNRAQFALAGRMPITRALPNEWYDTPNIHLCSLKDFEHICAKLKIRIMERRVVDHAHRSRWHLRLFPNLFSEIALYRFRRA